MGFGIYRGVIPTVSNVQPDRPFHIAFDSSRIIFIRSFPSELLAEIADVQPLSSKPVLGVSHTTWIRIKPRTVDDWEEKYTRISTALGIGRLRIDSAQQVKKGIGLDPQTNPEKLIQLGKDIGLTDFLSLPVDNLPIYGTFRVETRQKVFTERTLKKMLSSSMENGHHLAVGNLTSLTPKEVLKNPEILIKELNKTDLLEGINKIQITRRGEEYVNEKIAKTAQEAALMKTADMSIFKDLRQDFRHLEQNLTKQITLSKSEMLHAIKEIKLEIGEIGTKQNMSAKYIISTSSISLIQMQLEIPIGEISKEELDRKIAEIKTTVRNLPSNVAIELGRAIKKLPKISNRVKRLLLNALS